MSKRAEIFVAFRFFVLAVFFGAVGMPWGMAEEPIPELSKNRQTYFSPAGGSDPAVASAIDLTKTTLLVQAPVLTSRLITMALVNVYQRGIRVQVILEKGRLNAAGNQADTLIRAGVPVRLYDVPGVSIDTIMVIDAKTVIAGASSFSKPLSGTHTSKSLLIMDDIMLAAQYARDWNNLWQVSKPCENRTRKS